ncbi:MAG: sulfatase-like hydrolase/transferase [Myxococcales bacterium]
MSQPGGKDGSALARGLSASLRLAAGWLACASVGTLAVLLLSAASQKPAEGGVLATLAYLTRLSLLSALLGSVPLAALHGLRLLAARLGQGRREGLVAGTALVAGAAAAASDAQARFLAAGPSVVEAGLALEVHILLTVGLTVAYVGLWLWHVLGLKRSAAAVAAPRPLATRLRTAGWYLLGAAALGVITYFVSYRLTAYAAFARFLLPAAWLLAATLLARALRIQRIRPLPFLPFLVCLVLLALISEGVSAARPVDFGRARNHFMRRGQLAALTDLLVHPAPARLSSIKLARGVRIHCEPHPATRPLPALDLPEKARRNVILVSVDAMRADAIDWDVDGRPVMPRLRAFRKRTVDFRRAVSTYPATLLSMGGALTGLDASQLFFAPRVPDNVFTRTRADFDEQYISLPISRWFRRPVVSDLLIQKTPHERDGNARAQVDWLIRRLRKARRHDRSVFAWLHLFEPHKSYESHRGHDFGDDARGRYASELSYVDVQLGRFFDFLKRRKFMRNSLIIFVADHGQALGEHDYFGHHVYLNSWITDIPLLVHAPGLKPRVSRELVDITDVAVTILQFVGRDAPQASRGVSLLLPEGAREGRVSFAEAFPVRGADLFRETRETVRDLDAFAARMEQIHMAAQDYLPKVSAVSADYRLIVNRVTGLRELYDRAADPQEEHDLSHQGLPAQRFLESRLTSWSRAQAQRLYCEVQSAQR